MIEDAWLEKSEPVSEAKLLLLDEPDWDIFYWATNKKPVPERWQKSDVLSMITQHAKNEDKKVLRMPDLETTD